MLPQFNAKRRELAKRARKETLGLFLIVVLAFFVRFPIAFTVFGSADMASWELRAKLLSEHRNPYMEPESSLGYPPLWMMIQYCTNSVSALIRWPWYAVAKTWLILSDIITILLLYSITKKGDRYSANSLIPPLVFAVYPLSILITSVHGNPEPLVTMLLLASVYCLLNLDPRTNIFWSGIFLGLSIYCKLWPLLVLPAFLTQIAGWKNKTLFSFIAVLPTVCGLGPMYAINPEVMLRNFQKFIASTGWWGFTGLAYLFPNCVPAALVSEFLSRYGRYLILLLPWTIFLSKKSPSWSLVDKVVISLLLSYALTPNFGPQYLAWIIPYAILSRKRIFALWSIYASVVFLLEYGFATALGQFAVVLSGSQFPFLEGFIINQYNVVLLRLPLWIIFLIWLRNIWFPFGKKYDNAVSTEKPRIEGAKATRRRVRTPKLLACALILAILVGYYVAVLYPRGKLLIERDLSDIEGASPEVKPLIAMSAPVLEWEINLYERHLSFDELGAELGNHWKLSASITDIYAWNGRMRIYTNTLDVLGYQAYIPVSIQFKVAWESFGEEGLLLIMAIYAIHRETKLRDLHRMHGVLLPLTFLALYIVTLFTTRLRSDFHNTSISPVALSVELLALAVALSFPALQSFSAKIRKRLRAEKTTENKPS